jgi:hypothetical protein
MEPRLRGRAASAAKQTIRRLPATGPVKPCVTVVVPAYNYGRFLPECASSALTQEGVEVRVIIVDDCSTDDTALVTAELTALDSRVSVIRHDQNRGHIPSVNDGLERVETEYLVKLDADDLLAPGSLARSTALLEAHPNVGFVYGRPAHFSGAVPKARRARTRSWSIWPGREWVAARCRQGDNVISQPEVVMRTDRLRRLGSVCAELPHTSDLHQWLRLASIGDVGRINGPVQAYYRVHDQSMQRTVHSGELLRFRGRRAAFEAAFEAEAGALEGAEELREMFKRSLAEGALECACHRYDRGRTEAGGNSTDEIVAFALDIWPAARRLPDWRALEDRRAVGVERAPRHPRFVADALGRRALMEMRRWRWRQTGEL